MMKRIKRITSYAGHARFLAEVHDTNAWIKREALQAAGISSPYHFAPQYCLWQWQGKLVAIIETSHKRYDVFHVPADHASIVYACVDCKENFTEIDGSVCKACQEDLTVTMANGCGSEIDGAIQVSMVF